MPSIHHIKWKSVKAANYEHPILDISKYVNTECGNVSLVKLRSDLILNLRYDI